MWSRRRRILLVNAVDLVSVEELFGHCRALAEQGWRRVVIDASAVTGCDRAGLSGLCELVQGGAGLAVELTGVRWSQFFPALQATPLTELTTTHHKIRTLLAASSASGDNASVRYHPVARARRGRRGRHRRPPAATRVAVA
jgi:hypothetical protein